MADKCQAFTGRGMGKTRAYHCGPIPCSAGSCPYLPRCLCFGDVHSALCAVIKWSARFGTTVCTVPGLGVRGLQQWASVLGPSLLV